MFLLLELFFYYSACLQNLLLSLFLLLSAPLSAQIGGIGVFKAANLPASSRQAALGGYALYQNDSDVALAPHNPALLQGGTEKHLSLSYIGYLAGIKGGKRHLLF